MTPTTGIAARLGNTSPTVIATKDVIVHDDAMGIDRKIFAGTEVPADLHAAYAKETGEKVPEEPEDLNSLSVEDLQARADAAGLEVEGTGAGGRVVKADLVTALQAQGS